MGVSYYRLRKFDEAMQSWTGAWGCSASWETAHRLPSA